MQKKIKETFDLIYNKIKKNKNILILVVPFILIDIITRIFGRKYNIFGFFNPIPFLFNILWIFLIISLSINFKKGKFIYIVSFILSFILYLVNNIYYSMTNEFFSFNVLELASEGKSYFMDAILNCNIFVYLYGIIIFLTFILALKHYPKKRENNIKAIFHILLVFIILHSIIPLFMGKKNNDLTWNTWKNPRNIYENFNDSNKSIMISGIYEYTIRDFYITFLKPKNSINQDDLIFLENEYNKPDEIHNNNYTGLYKDKNLIIVQLEGLDNWLLTEEDTPTLYKMMNNGINFKKHFSYYNGGGSTFNSEFMVNTGFITPLSYNKNAYNFNKNSFPYSFARLFKQKGYSVNAFHMNTSEYYSRGVNYKNWDYDNYYGLKDLGTYKDDSYMLDRELILNETFNQKIFENEKFVDYIIAYSSHLPFSTSKGVCKMLVEEDTKKELGLEELPKNYVLPNLSEEQCARRQAKETDYMIELLMKNLKEKNLLDNTVVVVFTDHYLYTLSDQTILDKYKETSNNLINNTPFFIWDNGKTIQSVNEVTSQLNIFPTLINLFGLENHPNYYIGKDALDKSYKGYAFFNDYSWYDGNVYVQAGNITNGKKANQKYIENKQEDINNLIKKNDLTLKYDYFRIITANKNKNLT